jgi:predicted  nucleic acid-binding Zn-ribbon protein
MNFKCTRCGKEFKEAPKEPSTCCVCGEILAAGKCDICGADLKAIRPADEKKTG